MVNPQRNNRKLRIVPVTANSSGGMERENRPETTGERTRRPVEAVVAQTLAWGADVDPWRGWSTTVSGEAGVVGGRRLRTSLDPWLATL